MQAYVVRRPVAASGVLLALALAGALMAACGDAPSPDTSVVTVRDSAGIEIVEQSTVAVPRVALGEPYLELGSIDGEQDAFYQIVGLERLSDGSWIVANGGAVDAPVFGPDGDFIRTFVSQGDGPGELSGLSGLALLENDSVFVWDLLQRRGAVYTAGGELGRTVRLGDDAGRLYATPAGVIDGRIVMVGAGVSAGPPTEESRVIRPTIRGVILDPEATLVAELEPVPGRETWFAQRDGMIMDRLFPFAKEGRIAVAGDRIVTGDSGRDEVRVLDPSGDLRAIWRVLGEPVGVSSEDWAMQRTRALDEAESDADRQAIATMFDEMDRPDRRPAWSELLGAEDGSLWVRRYAAEGESDVASWWVVSPEGEVVREVTGPADFQLLWTDGEVVAGRYVDDFDAEYLRFYRLGGA